MAGQVSVYLIILVERAGRVIISMSRVRTAPALGLGAVFYPPAFKELPKPGFIFCGIGFNCGPPRA